MTETKAFNPEMKRVGKRKKFTQVKCFGIFSTDLTTARISLRQEIPISDALILDGFFPIQSSLNIPFGFSHKSRLLQHNFIDPFFRRSWRIHHSSRGSQNPIRKETQSSRPKWLAADSDSWLGAQQRVGIHTRHLLHNYPQNPPPIFYWVLLPLFSLQLFLSFFFLLLLFGGFRVNGWLAIFWPFWIGEWKIKKLFNLFYGGISRSTLLWKPDCGNMLSLSLILKITHMGGFVDRVKTSYLLFCPITTNKVLLGALRLWS